MSQTGDEARRALSGGGVRSCPGFRWGPLVVAAVALVLGMATAIGVCMYGALIASEPLAGKMIVYSARGARVVWTGYRFPGFFEEQYRMWDHSGARAGTLDARWAQVSTGANALNIDPRLFPSTAIREAERKLSDQDVLKGGMAVFVQGWPLRMVWYCEYWSGRPVNDTFVWRGPALSKKLVVDRTTYPKSGTRFMGLRPLWGGLIGNAAVFGGAWYALLSTPGLVMANRRRRRRRRGLCEWCGYDRRGVAGACPECGRPQR